MEHTFCVQDPSDPNTTYFYEALIEQMMKESLQSWTGVYAFATGGGVRALFREEPVVKAFAERGEIRLHVGVGAVTSVSALEELSSLNNEYKDFKATVLMTETYALFHPKVSYFRHATGERVLIVGSGNLTGGGLKTNTEAYSLLVGTDEELGFLAAWERFLHFHQKEIRDIDAKAMELAQRNADRTRRQLAQLGAETGQTAKVDAGVAPEESRVLVAQVPKAGGRWHQIHYNKDVVEQFFRVKPNSPQRVLYQEMRPDGTEGEVELRPLVYSEVNRNYKIEAAAGRGEPYSSSDKPPVIVLREIGTRIFVYSLLMPEDPGYEEILQLTQDKPNVGRGKPRVIVDYSELKAEWPACPL